MRRYIVGSLILGLSLLGSLPLHATEVLSEQELAKKIDQFLAARWKTEKIEPAPLADDAEYLRRLYLDLIGRIPSREEARAFLNDPIPDKRTRRVWRLLDEGAHVEHFVHVWRDLLIPETNNIEVPGQLNSFTDWLRQQFSQNVPYDRMISELLTVPFGGERVRSRRMMRNEPSDPAAPSPRAFYLAKDAKPEELAASTARLFLGVSIECAQCHNHPFASWTRQHFWGYAAFFAGLQRDAENNGVIREVFDRRDIKIPGSLTSAEARFLDETQPRWKYNVGARATLAEWLTAANNPYFARATVNRLWTHFFALGLVEPVDDFRPDNPPSHPELLDELARQFAAHHFDLRYLVRSITASRAYQLSSAAPASASLPPRLFAQMAVKGLSPEQLFDSLAMATGYRPPPRSRPMNNAASPDARAEFLARFAGGQPRTEMQRSIQQALMLMNGQFIADATCLKNGAMLASIANDRSLDTAGKVEALYLATLSRKPTTREAKRFVQYVEEGGPSKDAKQALADVFWVLLNSAEFSLNH